MHYAETKYGFEWACAKIQRIFSDKEKGWITLGVDWLFESPEEAREWGRRSREAYVLGHG